MWKRKEAKGLRACANRLASFRTWFFFTRSTRLFAAFWNIRYSPIGAASKIGMKRALIVWVVLAVLVLSAASCGPGGGGGSSSPSAQTSAPKTQEATTAERTSSTQAATTTASQRAEMKTAPATQAASGGAPILPNASLHPGATNQN